MLLEKKILLVREFFSKRLTIVQTKQLSLGTMLPASVIPLNWEIFSIGDSHLMKLFVVSEAQVNYHSKSIELIDNTSEVGSKKRT